MKDKVRILFVCLGNICRSPAADGIMQKLISDQKLSDEIYVDSAGTYGGHAGNLPDARMRKAASDRGYNFTHRSRQIQRADMDNFDMIIVMDDSNYSNVMALAQSVEHTKKIYRMCEFVDKYDIDHIPDPYYEGREGFEKVLDYLECGCENISIFVKQNNNN